MTSAAKFSVNKLIITVVLYTFLLYGKLSCVTLEKCRDDIKCNGGGRFVICAICGYSMDTSTHICIRPFGNLYHEEHGACRKIVNHCEMEPCSESGTSRSIEGYGTCRCQCKNKYYGNFCEKPGILDWSSLSGLLKGKKYASGFQLLVEPVISIDSYVTVIVTAQTVNTGTTKVQLTSDDGKLFALNNKSTVNKTSSPVDDIDYCSTRIKRSLICKYFSVKVAAAYEIRLLFPFQAIKDGPHVIKMRDVARGYVTKLFADVYDDKLLVSTVSQNVLILYPAKLPCIPSVKIENCQSNYNKRRKHRENFSMILKSHVSIVRDGTSRSDSEFRVFSGCPETNNYVWEAWKIVLNLDVEISKADISAYSYDWHLKPFMFTPGTYLIKLSVSSQLTNFAKCYLEIVPENVLLPHWYKSGSKSRVSVSEHRSHHRHRKRMKRKRSSFRNGTEDFD